MRSVSLMAAALLLIPCRAPAGADPPAYALEWGSYGTGPGFFDNPAGVAVDASGSVFVTETGNDRVQKFTADGAFVTAWGSEGAGPGQFQDPIGIAVDPEGEVLVADRLNHRIQRFTADGSFLDAWGSFGSGPGQFDNPIGLCADAQGNIYVGDAGNNRVQVFDGDGAFLLAFGSAGSGDGQFGGDGPCGVTVDGTGRIYATDTFNNRIERFTSQGLFVDKWGSAGSGNGRFNAPFDVFTTAGAVFVTEIGNHRVQEFDMNGTFVLTWGTLGTGPGEFYGTHGLEVDSSGRIFVADTFNNRIQVFLDPASGVPAPDLPPAARVLFATPNPGRGPTIVPLILGPVDGAQGHDVQAMVFDAAGSMVDRIFHGRLSSGAHPLAWDGGTGRGGRAEAGVYFVRVLVDNRPAGSVRLVRLP